MATKFFLRPIVSPYHFFLSSKRPPHSNLPIVSYFSATPQALPYGPSLHKGTKPTSHLPDQYPPLEPDSKLLNSSRDRNQEDADEDFEINEGEFTRVFDVSAIRVPKRECFVLEGRIRGHLLNWARVRNIARVPGDDVDEELVSLLGGAKNEEGKLEVLDRRIYGKAVGDGEELSPVLYRERLAKDFNSRGFVRFRNLAKISRPKRKKKYKGREEKEEKGRKGKDEFAVVEVVEEDDGEDWKGLLGHEFEGRRQWRGSTRLLLLDERYAEKRLDELPQAIKVALQEVMKENSTFTFELVKCKLILFYDYWQMNEILEVLLPKDMIVPSAFETVGHIAHMNLRDEHLPYKKLIAKIVLDKNKPKIQTVVNKTDAIDNDYRTMQLEVLAGNRSLVTMVVENGLRFHVDLATVYWNSRLATERLRLLSGFTRNDVLCDVFSGVGPITIAAAKIVKRVYANDLNPFAIDYMEKNIVLNKLEKKIEVFNMDGRRFINAMFRSKKAESVTQVVMNLPNDAVEYLDAFRGTFRDKPENRECTFPMIHVYGFSKAKDPEFDFHERIRIVLREVAVNVEMRRVRLVAPGKWMLCASFRLPESVAYANTKITC